MKVWESSGKGDLPGSFTNDFNGPFQSIKVLKVYIYILCAVDQSMSMVYVEVIAAYILLYKMTK